MEKTEKLKIFIDEILNNENTFKDIIFSVYDHKLSAQEANTKLMSYSQAVKDKELFIFEKYQKKYQKAFTQLYNLLKNELFFYTIYQINELPQGKDFLYLKKYIDGIDTVHEIKNIELFLHIINENLKEKLPFQNIIFLYSCIYLEFNFDFTFKLLFKNEISNMSILQKLKDIFTSNDLYIIFEGKNI